MRAVPSKDKTDQHRAANEQVVRVSKELRRLGMITMGQVERSYGFVVITMSPTEAAAFADKLAQLVPSEE